MGEVYKRRNGGTDGGTAETAEVEGEVVIPRSLRSLGICSPGLDDREEDPSLRSG